MKKILPILICLFCMPALSAKDAEIISCIKEIGKLVYWDSGWHEIVIEETGDGIPQKDALNISLNWDYSKKNKMRRYVTMSGTPMDYERDACDALKKLKKYIAGKPESDTKNYNNESKCKKRGGNWDDDAKKCAGAGMSTGAKVAIGVGVAAAAVGVAALVANATKKSGGGEEEANTAPQVEVQKTERVVIQTPQMAQLEAEYLDLEREIKELREKLGD